MPKFQKLASAAAAFGLLLNLTTVSVGHASVDSVPGDDSVSEPQSFEDFAGYRALDVWPENFLIDPISGAEAYRRAEAVFDHFGVPAEDSIGSLPSMLQETQTLEGARAIRKILDPHAQADRFFGVETAGATSIIALYSDRDSKLTRDFSTPLAESRASQRSVSDLARRLGLAVQNGGANKPLAGLRIALDPGHMGGDFWDNLTGKFVKDRSGRKLSEGVMAIQVSLLLEKELQDLGATVMLTHRSPRATSTLDYQTFPIEPFAKADLRANSLENWFQTLIARNPPGDRLYNSFSSNSQFKKLFSESARSRYFILKADLDARSEMIREFNPDISLVIHFDTSDPPGNPNGINTKGFDKTKTYIAGGFDVTEFATKEQRRGFAKHWLDQEAWDASFRLSRSVVGHLSQELGIPKETPSESSQVTVEPGVVARNLALSRKLANHAVTYVECLYYNDPREFNLLYDRPHPLMIEGVNYPYSDRLAQVVKAIRGGIVDFVRGYAR